MIDKFEERKLQGGQKHQQFKRTDTLSKVGSEIPNSNS